MSKLLHRLTPEGTVEVQYRVPRTDGGILLGPMMGVSGQQMPVPLRGLLWPESTNVIFEASHHRILDQLAKAHLYNTTQDRKEEDFRALHLYTYQHKSMIQATITNLKQRIKNWKCMKSFLELRKLYPLRENKMDKNAEEMASFRVDRTLVEALLDLQIYQKQKPLIDCENLSAIWDDCDTRWKRLEERCMRHPPDGGEDGQLLHEIYPFAQKELSQLKDKGLKTGRGSSNHPQTNEKITRSKNYTGYSEWDNPKGKTLSYVLRMYQTRQLMWARDFFRHHIDNFNAKCQDNKSQIPSGIPLDQSGLAILGTIDACDDWLKQCEQYINWKSKSLLQSCIKAKTHPQPEADDRVSDILQDIQSRDTPQPRNRSKYLMRCDLVYRLVYEKLSQREREYKPNGQRREKPITFAECMKRVYQRWDQGSLKELEENLRWDEENPITNKESIVDDGLEPVGQSGRLMEKTSSDEVSLGEKASLWASVYYQLASPVDAKKPFLEICAAGTYVLRSKEEIVIMEGVGLKLSNG